MDISALQSKQLFIMRMTWKASGLLRTVCVENNKLTVLNMSLDDLSEHALSVIDLKTKLKISPTNKSTCHSLRSHTQNWLRRSHMLPTAEVFVFAMQHEAISKCSYLKHIIKNPKLVNDTYRLCGSSSDTIQHVIVSCPKLAHNK